MSTTVTLACSAASRIFSPSTGSGASLYIPVGLWSGGVYRSLAKFTMPDWTGLRIKRILSATLKLRTSTQFYVGFGSSPRIIIRRCKENWSEGSADTLSSGNAVTWSNQPAVTALNETDLVVSTSEGVLMAKDITTLFRSWAPVSVEGGGGSANYGLMLLSYDESTSSRTTEFYSDDASASVRPYITLVYESNSLPNAPTNLTPASVGGEASIAEFSAAREITISGSASDPDPGDYITGVQVQIFADTATDATPGTAIVDTNVAVTGSPTTFRYTFPVAALVVGTKYRARVRTKDRDGAWGAYSSLLDMRFIPDTLPSAPANPAQDLSTQTPTFYGSLVDVDPSSSIAEVRILVYQDTSDGPILKWDSGFVASGSTRFAIPYSGSTLDFGSAYRWAGQIKDNVGGIGPLGAYTTWTPTSTAGPTAMTPINVETKQNSLTPTLTIGHGVTFDQYELEVARYNGGPADLWDVGVTTMTSATTKAVTYAGAALTWGRTFFWRAKVRASGTTWTEWSPWYPFYLNAIPNAPTVTIPAAVSSGAGAYGAYVTGITTTPIIGCTFSDPDLERGYADVPTGKQVEIRRADTLAALGSYSPLTVAGTANTHTVGTAMTAGVTYQIRVRWQDGAGQYGPWSPWLFYKPSTALTITVGTAPSTTDPTPTFSWTLNRAQKYARVVVTNTATGAVVHDSGLMTTTATNYTMPGYILQSGVAYGYTVTAFDADGLSAVLT